MSLLSVVVPAYNEQENVEKSASTIAEILVKAEISFEIIFVNDGSRDDTWHAIERAAKADSRVRGISFSRNFGKESAILAGLSESKGDCCVVIDCDLQQPPETMVDMYRLWKQGYKVVNGVKSSRGKESVFHKLAAKLFYSIMSFIVKIDMKKASDYKLIDREVVDVLLGMPERNYFFRALSECGQRAFGENKVQDLRAKIESLDDLPLEWHFIGNLQENKINTFLSLNPTLLHSLDSIKLALALQKRLGERKIRALLQVNAANEPTKSGVSVESAKEIYEQICATCPNIKLEGIMSIGAHSDKRADIEKSFKLTRDVFDSLKDKGARILSMGMSGDFEIAIAYGANIVRIGSKLFEEAK